MYFCQSCSTIQNVQFLAARQLNHTWHMNTHAQDEAMYHRQAKSIVTATVSQQYCIELASATFLPDTSETELSICLLINHETYSPGHA